MCKQILTLCSIILFSLICAGCGGDDGGPTNPPQPTSIRVVAAEPATSPSISSVNDAVWNSITPTQIDIASSSVIGSAIGTPAGLSDSVKIQAARRNDSLWIRLQWTDNTYDVWPSAYIVDSVTSCDGVNPCVWFRKDEISLIEDQVIVTFAGLGNNLWDALNWRVLTTGAGGLAQGMTISWDTAGPAVDSFHMESDAAGSNLIVAHDNGQFSSLPQFFHPDTSDYTGHLLYLGQGRNATPLMGGWTVGQRVPGYLIDTSVADNLPEIRGSRWDTHAISDYNGTSDLYTLVLVRRLNTGYADDINLMTRDSVQTQVGVFDNFQGLNGGSTYKGFTKKFWLIF